MWWLWWLHFDNNAFRGRMTSLPQCVDHMHQRRLIELSSIVTHFSLESSPNQLTSAFFMPCENAQVWELVISQSFTNLLNWRLGRRARQAKPQGLLQCCVVRRQKTILFSHGNGSDCGHILLHMDWLRRTLGVNVLFYEYTGQHYLRVCVARKFEE